MTHLVHYVIVYGVTLVFLNVLAEQLGVPIPAVPALVIAGALTRSGRMSSTHVLIAAVIASLIADSVWYELGRRYGYRILKTLCRVSLSPDSCVRDTEARFERWGLKSLLIAKFIPGFSTVAPPLAGAGRIVGRQRRGHRLGHGAAGYRIRRGRLDPHPIRVVRPLRVQAVAGTNTGRRVRTTRLAFPLDSRADGPAQTPRRKPRGQPRPPEDVVYNRHFARRRVIVEHTIGRLRRFQCLSQTDRHHRQHREPRRAVGPSHARHGDRALLHVTQRSLSGPCGAHAHRQRVHRRKTTRRRARCVGGRGVSGGGDHLGGVN